jgi:tetratricopeptide (TPR) repeat protein
MSTNPDRLAELEEERRFLLRSLADLEREREAGDVDVDDYRALRDGYTVRAASVLRSIEDGRTAQPSVPSGNWRRHLVAAVVVVVVAGGLGWFVARSSGQRLAGQEISGLDPRDEIQVMLAQARAVSLDDPAQAAAIYGEVIERDPDHVEAVTYYGWTTALTALTSDSEESGDLLLEAIKQLSRATELDPSYPDPFCFLGIIEYRFLGEAAVALPNIERCLAGGPPADVRDQVEGLLAQIEAEVAAEPSAAEPSDTEPAVTEPAGG